MILQTTEIRNGHAVKWQDQVWVVVSYQHITPGNWRGYVTLKMRNIATGSAVEQRFSSEDRLELSYIEQHNVEYLYQEGESYVFMNQENYEQTPIHKDLIGEDVKWLKENTACKINYCDGRAIGVELPTTVDLEVVQTDPPLRGATITNVYKPAKLETGAVVQVPPFIQTGERIRVDTRKGEYVERA